VDGSAQLQKPERFCSMGRLQPKRPYQCESGDAVCTSPSGVHAPNGGLPRGATGILSGRAGKNGRKGHGRESGASHRRRPPLARL